MTSFIIESLCSLYNSFRLRIWPQENLKRRRDSVDEDEEDDIIFSCETLSSKRPKWMPSVYPSNISMASDASQSSQCSSRSLLLPKLNHKRNFQQKSNPDVKENGSEVIELEELDKNNHTPVESRPPLSTLAVRRKTKDFSSNVTYNNSASRSSQRNRLHERRQNGVLPGLFNSCPSSSASSKTSFPKQTALNETFKIDEKLKYSRLLADYHKSSKNSSVLHELHHSRKDWPLVSSIMKPSSGPRSVELIDLTCEDRKRTRIPVKPWQSPVVSSDDEEVQIIEQRPVTRVNSLEKRLSHNSLFNPRWIDDIQQKYNEKERERQRQVEEAKLRKELYAQHNQSKRIEALDERIRKHLKIIDVVLDDTEDIAVLPEITPEIKKKIDAALKPNPPNEVLVEGFGQRITRHDIQTLNKLNWLNDEVINFYMNLIIERGKQDKNLRVYAFNTFFYPKLISQGYNSLKRWTKKVDIFSYDVLLAPIHLGMHWCMAVIDFRDKSVRYYDSMGSANNRCLNALLQYLNDESLDKKKTAYNTSNWKADNVKDIPQQMNGSDCGMFSCMFAEYLSRNAKITFSQKDMPYFRQKMVYEIISKTLLQ